MRNATDPHADAHARNARLLLAGDGLSAFGTWIDFLAILTLAAYQFKVTPYQMAVVSAAGLLPGMLAAPLIGRLCDRGNPKQLLLLSIVGRVGVTAAILFCHDYLLFVVLVGLRSVFATVAPPAINVMAVRSVAPDQRQRFYAVLNVLNNAAKVLAPAIGTVSSSLSSEAIALVLSLVFSAASFVVFACVRPAAQPPHATAANETVVTAASNSVVPLLWIAATCAFFIFMVNNLVPLVLQRAGFDKALLGVLVSCSGAGNILSGLWLAKRSASSAMRGRIGEMLLPAMLQALGFGTIGLLLWLAGDHAAGVLPLVFFLIGTVSARYAIALNVHLSTHFAASIGSVSGLLQAWQQAMIFVAPMVGALVLDRWGGGWLFAAATGSAALSFGLLLALQAMGLTLRMPAHRPGPPRRQ
jgi:MFS transporter, DHA1 family, staphyloferrin B biosynthesis exporter